MRSIIIYERVCSLAVGFHCSSREVRKLSFSMQCTSSTKILHRCGSVDSMTKVIYYAHRLPTVPARYIPPGMALKVAEL